MSAMRILSFEELKTKLKDNDFKETGEIVAVYAVWIHEPTSIHIFVPTDKDDVYPDAILDEYLRTVGVLYQHPASQSDQSKMYAVSPKKTKLTPVK